MKLFSCILLLSFPLMSFAWDGSGYDYKRGRATNIQQDYQTRYSEGSYQEHYAHKKYHEHGMNVFDRLGNSFSVVIPDPSYDMHTIIDTTPNYFW